MTHGQILITRLSQWLHPLGYCLDFTSVNPNTTERIWLRSRELYLYPANRFVPDYTQVDPNQLHLSALSPKNRSELTKGTKIHLKINLENPKITKTCPFGIYTIDIYLPY